MLRKMLIGVCALMLAGLPFVSAAGAQTSHRRESVELTASAKSFLSAWLVKRDVREAMRFVGGKPVLSKKCDLPPDVRRVPGSAKQRRRIMEQDLSTTLKVFPTYESFDSAVKPSKIPASDWFEVEEIGAFQILRIKPGRDGRMICKFEENAAYRRALSRPGVYYVAFDVSNVESSDLSQWISAWAKEGKQWRLISIGLIED